MSDSIIKIDGTFTSPQQAGGKTWVYPIPTLNAPYMMTQDWVCFDSDFTNTDIGTVHPDHSDFVLVQEGDRQPIGGGLVKWQRTYAKRPPTHFDYGTASYRFIGFAGVTGINPDTYVTGRDPFVDTVPCRTDYKYFTIKASSPNPALDEYETPDLIPIEAATKYYWGTDPARVTDYLAEIPAFQEDTEPTPTEYATMIAGGWTTGIVIEDSSIERWAGNFWVRKTRKVKAR